MEETKTKRKIFKEIALNRIGETRRNHSYGSLMCIDEYNNSTDIWIRFIETGTMVHTTYQNFINGRVKDVYDPTVFGIGYLGEGSYQVKIDGVTTPQYKTWSSMLRRCYSVRSQLKFPCYKGCTVIDSWLNFNTFAQWYDENYYEVDGEVISLDKDILCKENKVYSPETCVFIPRSINTLYAKCNDMKRILNKLETYKGKIPDEVYEKVYISLKAK